MGDGIVSHFRVDRSDICFYCGRDRADRADPTCGWIVGEPFNGWGNAGVFRTGISGRDRCWIFENVMQADRR